MRRAAAAAVVVAAVVLIYARSTSGYFFNDDFHWLEQTQSFVPANMLDLSRYDHFYRPVIELYFFAGLSLFGCEPFGFHVTSIVIHLLTTLVVYLFARALPSSALFAFLSALLFAVQPGLTDAVTWIGAITDQLPGLWYVMTLWLHRRFLRPPARELVCGRVIDVPAVPPHARERRHAAPDDAARRAILRR